VRLQLHALAYNLGNFLRTLATPEPIKDWSLSSLKEKLIKIGAKVISHGRSIAFQMAEVAIPRQMLQEILRLIAELRPKPTACTSMRRPMVMRLVATDGRTAPRCRGNETVRTQERCSEAGSYANSRQPGTELTGAAENRYHPPQVFRVHPGNPAYTETPLYT
jgi:hypothetical protein